MAIFKVTGPSDTSVTGGTGHDRLVYWLESGIGPVWLDNLTRQKDGYAGRFQVDDGDDTWFSGIDSFTFYDKVGGDDFIRTGNGRDRIYAGNGNDTLFGGGGADILRGGNGYDRLEGGAGGDLMFGGNGGDMLVTLKGADRAYGGNGNDGFETSFDTGKLLDGGNGRDSVMAFHDEPADDTASIHVNLTSGVMQLLGPREVTTTLVSIEDFHLVASLDATLIGSATNNRLWSDEGNDRLDGRDGNDDLFGGAGDDALIGGKGRDRLDGGEGNDTLKGGKGADTFVFNAGHDTILDFQDDRDTIQIASWLVAPGTTVQNLIDMAQIVDGNTVLSVADNHVLTINGISDASTLLDDMLFI